jgi:hypothetical protein
LGAKNRRTPSPEPACSLLSSVESVFRTLKNQAANLRAVAGKALMKIACALILLAGAYPLWRAWRTNWITSLLHSVAWASFAWLAWVAVLFVPEGSALRDLRYVALSLTGCAGVAVLGARRPGVSPWNFVVLALLALDLLPMAEGAFTGRDLEPGALRMTCLVGTVLVGVVNYLPTRFYTAAMAALAGSLGTLAILLRPAGAGYPGIPVALLAHGCIALTPWLALFARQRKLSAPFAESDRLWLDFRDRFGFVWSKRLCEQFNNAARHARWPVRLSWYGMELMTSGEPLSADKEAEIVNALRALTKRFGVI